MKKCGNEKKQCGHEVETWAQVVVVVVVVVAVVVVVGGVGVGVGVVVAVVLAYWKNTERNWKEQTREESNLQILPCDDMHSIPHRKDNATPIGQLVLQFCKQNGHHSSLPTGEDDSNSHSHSTVIVIVIVAFYYCDNSSNNNASKSTLLPVCACCAWMVSKT